MTNEIPEIPDVPDEIVEAINNDKLAVFIGAGVSRLKPINCMGWDELASKLVDCCYNHGIINFREKETICQFTDHKKIISICHELLKEKGFEENFFEQLKHALKDNEEVATPNIYDDIKRIRGLFITTNVDRHFDKLFPNDKISIVYKETDFRPDNIDRTKLYHIHGSISDPDSLVFTVQQYFKRYKHNTDFIEFLKRIFDEYITFGASLKV